MLDTFLRRPDYVELTKTVHPICATITTIFLVSRLVARKTCFSGFWYDDYLLTAAWAILVTGNGLAGAAPSLGFNVATGNPLGLQLAMGSMMAFYLAAALAKSAFISTLLRLSSGTTKIILGTLLAATWLFAVASSVVAWLPMCGMKSTNEAGIEGICLGLSTTIWVHTGSAISTILTDLALAYIPWRIISKVQFPSREKVGLGISMSLVGFAAFLCIARIVIAGYTHKWNDAEQVVDWTYGLCVLWCLLQGEVAIYIIAQAIPMIRVLAFGSGLDPIIEVSEPSSVRKPSKGQPVVSNLDSIEELGTELVVLSTGRVVRADSYDARGQKDVPKKEYAESTSQEVAETDCRRQASEDPVHTMYEELGLSKRAWSKSPSTSPSVPATHNRGISDVSDSHVRT